MVNIPALRALCWVMVVMMAAAPLMADVSVAVIHPRGQVQLNGTSASGSTAIYAGDLLQTQADAAVAIASKGSTVLLAANTAVLFGGDHVGLSQGSALITTSNGMSAQVGGFKIAPAKDAGRFRVTEQQGKIEIAALGGALTVLGPSGATTLEPGATMAVGAQNQGSSANSAGHSFLTPEMEWVILVAGLVSAGLIVAAVNAANDDESPSN